MNQLKLLIQGAESKLNSVVTDIEDLTISKNRRVNILDVVEEIKVTQKMLNEALSITLKQQKIDEHKR
jgi:hypothetical protein